eukprot:TRINITY_DN335_c0_g1_i2.p1 TRINITY_DN335_c0_g1~~TRINITY_DN335_c0_g1_i2.p1  ORF type:complete len:1174 (+),score=250.66 TRINITY_DN335_c0_g1_i2:88-3522(+)
MACASRGGGLAFIVFVVLLGSSSALHGVASSDDGGPAALHGSAAQREPAFNSVMETQRKSESRHIAKQASLLENEEERYASRENTFQAYVDKAHAKRQEKREAGFVSNGMKLESVTPDKAVKGATTTKKPMVGIPKKVKWAPKGSDKRVEQVKKQNKKWETFKRKLGDLSAGDQKAELAMLIKKMGPRALKRFVKDLKDPLAGTSAATRASVAAKLTSMGDVIKKTAKGTQTKLEASQVKKMGPKKIVAKHGKSKAVTETALSLMNKKVAKMGPAAAQKAGISFRQGELGAMLNQEGGAVPMEDNEDGRDNFDAGPGVGSPRKMMKGFSEPRHKKTGSLMEEDSSSHAEDEGRSTWADRRTDDDRSAWPVTRTGRKAPIQVHGPSDRFLHDDMLTHSFLQEDNLEESSDDEEDQEQGDVPAEKKGHTLAEKKADKKVDTHSKEKKADTSNEESEEKARRTNSKSEKSGEARRTNSKSEKSGEARRTNSKSEKSGEAGRTNSKSEKSGEARRTNSKSEKSGEAGRTNSKSEKSGEALQTDDTVDEATKSGAPDPNKWGGSLWPGGIIQWCFHKDVKPTMKAVVKQSMAEFNKALPGCLEFKEVPYQSGTHQPDGVLKCNAAPPSFMITSIPAGCTSYVGKQAFEEKKNVSQRVNLQDGGCQVMGIAMHELMHVIGMLHEQSRPDRDQWIKVNYNNIGVAEKSQFDIDKKAYTTNSPYDYNSLMHYGAHDFATNRAVPTIEIATVSSQKLEIGQRVGPSNLDIEQIYTMYVAEAKKMGRTCKATKRKSIKCVDKPNWKDANGNNCAVYIAADKAGTQSCKTNIASLECCYCGGGVRTVVYETLKDPKSVTKKLESPNQKLKKEQKKVAKKLMNKLGIEAKVTTAGPTSADQQAVNKPAKSCGKKKKAAGLEERDVEPELDKPKDHSLNIQIVYRDANSSDKEADGATSLLQTEEQSVKTKRQCCTSLTARCAACWKKVSKADFCNRVPAYLGCPGDWLSRIKSIELAQKSANQERRHRKDRKDSHGAAMLGQIREEQPKSESRIQEDSRGSQVFEDQRRQEDSREEDSRGAQLFEDQKRQEEFPSDDNRADSREEDSRGAQLFEDQKRQEEFPSDDNRADEGAAEREAREERLWEEEAARSNQDVP